MEQLFNSITTQDGSITIITVLCTLIIACILGLLISLTYMRTQNGVHSQSFAITLIMLPVILSVIILFVGSNVARAFSLAGTVAIIRFRSAPGEPKDIGFIFFAMAAGLACGVGVYIYGVVFTILLCAVMLALKNQFCPGFYPKKTAAYGRTRESQLSKCFRRYFQRIYQTCRTCKGKNH